MKPFVNSLVLLTSSTLSSVLAFEPLSELFPRTCVGQRGPSPLHVAGSELDNHHDRTELATNDISFLLRSEVFDGTFSFFQEKADALAFETFEGSDSLELHELEDCGDDCIECEIPKNWCISDESIDVMAYLGITRAKPLG